CFQVGEVDTSRKFCSNIKWLDVLIAIFSWFIAYLYQTVLSTRFVGVMEVELSARDIAALGVKVEGAMAWFGCVQHGGIDGFVEAKAIFVDQCIPDVDLAEKYLCISL